MDETFVQKHSRPHATLRFIRNVPIGTLHLVWIDEMFLQEHLDWFCTSIHLFAQHLSIELISEEKYAAGGSASPTIPWDA
jgi:hypothetical protein